MGTRAPAKEDPMGTALIVIIILVVVVVIIALVAVGAYKASSGSGT